MNALLALSLKAKSIQLTPAFVWTAVLALMFAPLVQSLQVNNRPHLTQTKNCRPLFHYSWVAVFV